MGCENVFKQFMVQIYEYFLLKDFVFVFVVFVGFIWVSI